MNNIIETIGMLIIAAGIIKILFDHFKEIEAHEETKRRLIVMTALAAAMPEVVSQAKAILNKQNKRKTPIKKKKK